MAYKPTVTARKILLLRPEAYAKGDGYGAFGPDGNRLVGFWRMRGAFALVREIDVTDGITGARVAGKDAATAPHAARMQLRFRRLLAELSELKRATFDTLVIACHGWVTGLQLGVTVANAGQFADALIAAGLTHDADIFLAACSAGSGAADGDRSVADTLRDALAARGHTEVTVYAHTTAGMAFRNPYVRVFATNGSKLPLMGGYYLVNPKAPTFKPWSKAMTRKTEPVDGFLWCRFFDMSDAQVEVEAGVG